MFENTYYIFMILLAIVFVSIVFIFSMYGRGSYETNIFHKVWLLIQYAFLKFEVGVGYGIMALENLRKNKGKEKASQYLAETSRMKMIQRKEKRICEMRERYIKRSKGKKGYNMKILD